MRSFLLVAITACLIVSCRSTRKIQTAIAKKDTVVTPVVVEPVQPKEDSAAFIKDAISKMNSERIDFKTFSAKVDVDYKGGDGKKYNVNASLRMYKDSVIWISVTAIFGIEGLRAYITKDSVKILNKQDKVYTARSVAYLREMTALPLDLHSLQDVLIGNPVFIDGNIISYTKAENTNSVTLLSLGSVFKHLLTLNKNAKVESSKLDDADVSKSRTCTLLYDNYENKKGVHFATGRRIIVSEKNNLDIKLDFKQYEFNETLSFPFSVPKNYKTD